MARILVVDDNSDVLTLVADLLRRDGHHVTEAWSSHEAWELVERPLLPELAEQLHGAVRHGLVGTLDDAEE